MSISRRAFIRGAAASVAAPLGRLVVRAQEPADSQRRLFRHGVASGDPLSDRVILWTRVTPLATRSATGPIEVTWVVAADERLAQIVARGTASATPARDFTVKVDATGLQPGRPYFYAFEAGGQRSPVGRTKTLPADGVDRVRLAVLSCSNYPAGYFNVYRCVANRSDLDVVIHVGDYIYEFANGVYGDGSASGRVPLPGGEAATLADYRLRYATYRSDADLQEAHRLHPFVVVWDDHEIANDAWSGGAANHVRAQGAWPTRLGAAYRAYLEWLPVRDAPGRDIQLYRSFRIGDMADLVMLDTRGLRDRQPGARDRATMNDPRRTLLGAAQEAWLFEELRVSRARGSSWRLLGQQVLFSPVSPSGPFSVDMWDGYPVARRRVLDFLAREKITDLAILTGDLHSSWALDVPADPWAAATSPAARSLAVELVTPAISSPPFNTDPALRARAATFPRLAPHLKYLEGDSNGYVLLDLTRQRLQADWYSVATVTMPSDRETRTASFVNERGSARLTRG
jgi:alkaline phosphatase D